MFVICRARGSSCGVEDRPSVVLARSWVGYVDQIRRQTTHSSCENAEPAMWNMALGEDGTKAGVQQSGKECQVRAYVKVIFCLFVCVGFV